MQEEIEKLYYTYKCADELVLEIKATTLDEVIPAVLQLRYAGWHLFCYLKHYSSNNEIERKSEYLKVIEHSNRAKLEASKYGVLFCMQAIKNFRDIYRGNILPNIIHDYSTKMRKCNEARRFLNNKDDDVNARVELCYSYFIELRKIHDELIECEPELTDVINANKKISQKFVISTGIAILSIIVAIALALFK